MWMIIVGLGLILWGLTGNILIGMMLSFFGVYFFTLIRALYWAKKSQPSPPVLTEQEDDSEDNAYLALMEETYVSPKSSEKRP